MITVDRFLVNLIHKNANIAIPKRDFSVLKSLAQSSTGANFITENQSKLLLKILKEHSSIIAKIAPEVTEITNLPTWSRNFRKIEQVRKLYISSLADGSKVLAIEFTFSSSLRKLLTEISKKVENLHQINPGKTYHAELTEKNIVTVVDELSPRDFQIEETIKEYYDTIKNWSKSDIESQFSLENINNLNFQKHIISDLGEECQLDNILVADRSIRYQYFLKNERNSSKTLLEMLAFRSNPKVWVDSTKFSLDNLVSTLIELKRLPVLLVFDSYNVANQHEILLKLSVILEKHNITDNVGIYFRLPNSSDTKKFNELIAEKKYNAVLDETTTVVGVQSGKIPKFLLKTNWKPMSVVSINNVLRNSKTAVYANCCDLVISYTDKNPIIGEKNIWL